MKFSSTCLIAKSKKSPYNFIYFSSFPPPKPYSTISFAKKVHESKQKTNLVTLYPHERGQAKLKGILSNSATPR